MNKSHVVLIMLLAIVSVFSSCKESDDTFNPYHNWAARNATYYINVADTARTAIAAAKKQYGDVWEEHCEWRMYKSTTHDSSVDLGRVTDSICVRVLTVGIGSGSPIWTDTVRVNYRGTLMPYENIVNGKDTLVTTIFDQSYYGELNQSTSVPAKMAVSGTIAGFSTALQHMHNGDIWQVYIPQQLGYGSSTISGVNGVPAYSTLIFKINLVAYYRVGTVVPEWQ